MSAKKYGLDASVLRWFALLCMLLDHLWRRIVPGSVWMTYLGRLAFPIFAFQVAEGYIHTHNFCRYSKRLLFLAVISEIPFDLMMSKKPFDPFHQNVIVTLWLGLMSIRVIDQVRSNQVKSWFGSLELLGLLLLGYVSFPDYGVLGVLNVSIFYILRNFPGEKFAQLAAMIFIHVLGFGGHTFLVHVFGLTLNIPIQAFAVLSLIPIWLYNGEKGSKNKYLQYFSYAFYPLHMLILSFF